MHEVVWLEPRRVPVGGEVGWHDGALRVWLDDLRPDTYSHRIQIRIATPALAPVEHTCHLGKAARLPTTWGPFLDPATGDGMLARRRGASVQLVALEPDAIVVRSAVIDHGPDVEVLGTLDALDAGTRTFVTWWLSAPTTLRWAGQQRRALRHPHVSGFGLQLGSMSTGALTTTFHRDGARFFVRTFGGCLAPVDTWFGPFVARGSGYELAS